MHQTPRDESSPSLTQPPEKKCNGRILENDNVSKICDILISVKRSKKKGLLTPYSSKWKSRSRDNPSTPFLCLHASIKLKESCDKACTLSHSILFTPILALAPFWVFTRHSRKMGSPKRRKRKMKDEENSQSLKNPILPRSNILRVTFLLHASAQVSFHFIQGFLYMAFSSIFAFFIFFSFYFSL